MALEEVAIFQIFTEHVYNPPSRLRETKGCQSFTRETHPTAALTWAIRAVRGHPGASPVCSMRRVKGCSLCSKCQRHNGTSQCATEVHEHRSRARRRGNEISSQRRRFSGARKTASRSNRSAPSPVSECHRPAIANSNRRRDSLAVLRFGRQPRWDGYSTLLSGWSSKRSPYSKYSPSVSKLLWRPSRLSLAG
jgi:hypothetical protein